MEEINIFTDKQTKTAKACISVFPPLAAIQTAGSQKSYSICQLTPSKLAADCIAFINELSCESDLTVHYHNFSAQLGAKTITQSCAIQVI
ncbi:MAG: hypothetical protein OFPI_40160 [Osedax symbiont Rs2]|nr:MAG: hypothetical protein OFPI_40160 [Osedax symbiont Rs2]